MLWIASLFFIQHLLEVGECLLLQIFLPSAEVDPSLEGRGREASLIVFYDFIDDLSCSFELSRMPEESGSADQVLVTGVLLPFVESQDVRVNRLLVNVSASLMVVDECGGSCERALSSVLDPTKLTDSLRNAAFLEYAERLPECHDGVLSLVKFLHRRNKL